MKWRDRKEPMNTVLIYTFTVMGACFLALGVYLGVVSFLAYLGGH